MKQRFIHLAYLFIIAVCLLFTNGAYAKDLFVAPSGGSDSVTWANNNLSLPWATVKKAFTSAQTGDIVYFRGGNYTIDSEISNSSAQDGTDRSPIAFKNYNNEIVNISGDCNGKNLIALETNHYYVEGINFSGSNFSAGKAIFFIAMNTDATNFKAINCTFTIESSNSADNVAAIHLQAARARNARIEFCTFNGPGKNNGIIIFRTQGAVVKNCELSGFQNAIYFKHSNTLEDTGVSFTNNYIHDSSTGIRTVANYSEMINNLFINCGIVMGDDGGQGDGYVGADYNTISHNTFYNGSVTLLYQTREEDPNKGCLHNTLKDNIFMQKSEWHRYHDIAAEIQSDYNLYPTGNVVIQNRVDYTLPTWIDHNLDDANSLSGSPIFMGGSGVSAYALTGESIGKNVASDDKDMGADVFQVGVQGGQTVAAPRNLRIVN